MNLASLEFEIKRAKLVKGKYGNDLVVSMVSVYKDGTFVKHATLNDELITALNNKGSIRFSVNTEEAVPPKAVEVLTASLDLLPYLTDEQLVKWFETHEMPGVTVKVSESVVVDRVHDYVVTHVMRINQYGYTSLLAKTYLTHLRDLYDALQKQGWTG